MASGCDCVNSTPSGEKKHLRICFWLILKKDELNLALNLNDFKFASWILKVIMKSFLLSYWMYKLYILSIDVLELLLNIVFKENYVLKVDAGIHYHRQIEKKS